ncbi:enolase-phosphatase E1 [Venturia canescens]|uniref:enolase-phosphatase E1 n=1 Tax=Venturia canescens TaxID=32260 RepID=UPI001C9BCD3A|nr:enolase-phosphatase E1 [Venturia canescens]
MSGEKRSQDSEDSLLSQTVVIVDIEGTTTNINFVKETLFPHVRENLKQYIEKNWDLEEFKADLEKLKEQAKKDETDKVEGLVSITGATPEEEKESLIKNVLWQMDGDRKTGALKQLQGHIWREAYKSGAIKGQVCEDVVKALEEWTKCGRKIYVYSSGSVEAQKLLFGHSEHGDMLKYFTDYFDTEVGAKQEASSYKNILAKIGVKPSDVLFLTDVAKEAQAAKEAGITAKIVVRPGNAPLTDEEKVNFTTIESFLDLSFQTSAKRQKVETPEEKVVVEPESSVPEPMDTSDGAAEPATESVVEKSEEKKTTDESKTTTETAKVEETKIPEKSQDSSMEVDVKVETEKKPTESVDKPAVAEETVKKDEEIKGNENKEVAKESPTVCEIAKKDTEVGKKENEAADKTESEAPKKEVEAAKSGTEVAKAETTEEIQKDEEVSKKEKEATKSDEAAGGASAAATTKLDTEPMDADKCVLPSKSETIATTKEEKTEVCAKPADPLIKTDKKAETEVSKPVETTVTDSKIDNETDEKKNIAARESSSTESTVTESKVEKTPVEENPTPVTSTEKTEPEVVPKTVEKTGTIESSEKPQPVAEEAKTDVKLNGDSASGKCDQVQSSDKKESNGEAKEETTKNEQVAPSVTEATKVSSVAEKTDEKMEPGVENTKKNETEVETKVNADATTVAVENTDAKLNGMATGADSGKEETEKPHRNGLNGDSSTEKSNGNTQNEAASSSQNGEAESSIGVAASSAESIKTKKVVDSTIADGAGEPDVVPPVAVAATS